MFTPSSPGFVTAATGLQMDFLRQRSQGPIKENEFCVPFAKRRDSNFLSWYEMYVVLSVVQRVCEQYCSVNADKTIMCRISCPFAPCL